MGRRLWALIERGDAATQDTFPMRCFIRKEAHHEVRRIHARLNSYGG